MSIHCAPKYELSTFTYILTFDQFHVNYYFIICTLYEIEYVNIFTNGILMWWLHYFINARVLFIVSFDQWIYLQNPCLWGILEDYPSPRELCKTHLWCSKKLKRMWFHYFLYFFFTYLYQGLIFSLLTHVFSFFLWNFSSYITCDLLLTYET